MTSQFSNILVRGTNWIGDSIITIPALRELRRIFPQARLTLMVKPWARDVFLGADYLDDLLIYDREALGGWRGLPKIIKEIRARRFDTAIFFQNAFEAAALAFLAGIPKRIGFPTDGRRLLLTDVLNRTPEILSLHQIYYYLHLVAQVEERFCGQTHVNFLSPQFRFKLRPEQQEAGRRVLAQHNVSQDKALVVLNPGCINSRARRWLPERFAGLADHLLERGDCTVVFIGAASENEIADRVIAHMRHQPVRLTGRTSLVETMGLLSLCDLHISNDTGPAYISAAMERPTLTVYGSSDFSSMCPISPTAQIVHAPVHCSPCMLNDCPTKHECMVGVTVEMVYDRALQLLGKAPAGRPSLPVLAV